MISNMMPRGKCLVRFCVALSARKVSMWLILLFAIFVAPGFSDGDQSRKGKTESEKKSNVRKKIRIYYFFVIPSPISSAKRT